MEIWAWIEDQDVHTYIPEYITRDNSLEPTHVG
jgi:hypothetical protein